MRIDQCVHIIVYISDSKVHGPNMGRTWGRQDPGGPHVGPMNFAIWDVTSTDLYCINWASFMATDQCELFDRLSNYAFMMELCQLNIQRSTDLSNLFLNFNLSSLTTVTKFQ